MNRTICCSSNYWAHPKRPHLIVRLLVAHLLPRLLRMVALSHDLGGHS